MEGHVISVFFMLCQQGEISLFIHSAFSTVNLSLPNQGLKYLYEYFESTQIIPTYYTIQIAAISPQF